MNYFTLMSYVLTTSRKSNEESDKAWMHVLAEALEDVSPIQAQILSTLTLLSNCLLSGQSLPPYLPLPQPYELMHHLLARDPRSQPRNKPSSSSQSMLSESSAKPLGAVPSYSTLRSNSVRPKNAGNRNHPAEDELDDIPEPEVWNLLDARNMEQDGYTEFAVLQVCSMLIIGELRGLIETVADLVGTVDFSFRVNPNNTSDTSLESMRRVGTWVSRAATGLESRSRGGAVAEKKSKHT